MTYLLWFFGFSLKALVFVFVIGVLVLVHEFGHFIVAKWCGVGVLKFAVGFGPAILRWRRGETVYQIGAIPLGGFVRMIGDIPDMITGVQSTDDAVREEAKEITEAPVRTPNEVEDDRIAKELFADRSRWFIEKGFFAKSAIVAAGPIFNFIFAFAVATACGFLYGQEMFVEEAVVGEVLKGSPGEAAGLKVGDEVRVVNGVPVTKWEQFAKSIHGSDGKTLALEVNRAGTTVSMQATPKPRTIGNTKMYFLGLSPSTKHESLNLFQSFDYGGKWLYEKTMMTYGGLIEMFAGRASPKELAGPIFIFQEAGRQVQKGAERLLYFMAIISVSLAVLNLLPVPVLDGGHLLFFIIEAIIGPISIRKKEFAQQVGMLLLLCLMAFAVKNDVFRGEQKEPDWNAVVGADENQQNPDANKNSAPAGSTPAAQPTATP